MINRTVSPHIKDAVEFDLRLKPCQRHTLDNGTEVYVVDAGTEEVLQIDWVFDAGNWYEDRNLVAASTNYLLKNGTHKKTAYALNEHFDYYGSYLNRHCFNESATITLHCLNRHLHELLPVVEEIISESAFTEEEIRLYKQTSKQKLSVNLKKCEFVAGRLIDEYLFGIDHPYGKYSSAEAFDAITRDQLLAYYKQFYTEGRCIIFVAGKIPGDILPLLNRHFGSLPFTKKDSLPVIHHGIRAAAEKKYRISNDATGVQGAVRLGAHFPGRKHPDFMKVQVLNTIFGGFFGSRLMSNIREDKGYTYGIHSHFENHKQQGAWLISTEAGRGVCEATIQEVYKEMTLLREVPVDDEELLLVRNYMMGSILGDLDGPFQIMAKWKNIVLHDLGESYFYDSINTIKSISAGDIQEMARKYLIPESFYELVVV